MQIKPFYLIVAALLVIALAIGVFAGRPGTQPAAAQPVQKDEPKTITVYAQDSVAVTPISVDVVAELRASGRTMTDATAALEKADKALREALIKAGVAAEQFSLDLHYTEPAAQPASGTTASSSQVRITERILITGLEPRKALTAMDVIGASGAWANPVRYEVKDQDRLIQAATEKAMKKARDQAYTAAQVAGTKVRGLLKVTIEPPGAFLGPQPVTGGSLAEASGTTSTAGSSSSTSSSDSAEASVLWRPALPPLNPDGTIHITVRIQADFEF